MSNSPVRVAVTGAAGQIGYALLFRIASGEMLGKDQPVILQLLEIPDEKAQKALKGVMMELEDCAFPLLAGMEAHADPMTAFKDTDYALLVGSRPRGPGMERAELLAINGAIFTAQGKALNAVASRNVKVLVALGWVAQGPGTDTRSRSVAITPAGRRKQAHAKAHWKRAQLILNERLGTPQVAALHTLIDGALAQLGTSPPPASEK